MIKILPEIKKYSKELDRIYKDIHSHPELGFEEIRTSQLVETKLKEFGVDEIHTGIAKTGVVAVINGVNEFLVFKSRPLWYRNLARIESLY